MVHTKITVVNTELLEKMNSDIQEIKKGLQSMSIVPQTDFITSDEFMSRTKISRWKFDALVREGLLEYRKIGRKYYIPPSMVQKYFDGEMVLK